MQGTRPDRVGTANARLDCGKLCGFERGMENKVEVTKISSKCRHLKYSNPRSTGIFIFLNDLKSKISSSHLYDHPSSTGVFHNLKSKISIPHRRYRWSMVITHRIIPLHDSSTAAYTSPNLSQSAGCFPCLIVCRNFVRIIPC